MVDTSVIFHFQSFLILCLLSVGIGLRKRRRLHVPIMSVAMVWDGILVLQIELFRDAIFKASRFMENSWLLNMHIVLAVTTLTVYGISVYTGRRLLRNHHSVRKCHRIVGVGAFILRVLTFLTGLIYSIGKGVG